jgi:hypothetical protein
MMIFFYIKHIFHKTKDIFIILVLFISPNYLYAEQLKVKSWVNLETKNSYPINNYQNSFLNNSTGLQVSKKYKNISSKITLNALNKKHLAFDHSNLEYKHNSTTIGIGKINRNWSFSPKTSLILSNNARPAKSVYLEIKNKNNPNNFFFSWIGPNSLELFNSVLSNTKGPEDAMLLGIRATFEPTKNLKFELVKTSQWGGSGYDANLSQLGHAILGDTNNSKYSEINQLAGFGISLNLSNYFLPLRVYGQFIGEDEAGSLPSCFMHLIGTEFLLSKLKYKTKLGLELVDTRIDETSHGNCGENAAYNNQTYKYTNYNASLGAPIDTESKSISFWGTTSLSPTTDFNYSLENIVLNDKNWASHRLSDTKQNTWASTVGISLKMNSFQIQSNIKYQGLNLSNHNLSHGFSLNLNSQYIF